MKNAYVKISVIMMTIALYQCGGDKKATTPKATAPKAVAPDNKKKAAEELTKFNKEILAKGIEKGELNPIIVKKELENILKLDPNNVIAMYNLAIFAELKKDQKQAQKLYERIVEMDKSFKPAALNLARIYVNNNQLKPAVALYREFIKNEPREIEARMALGQMLYRIGRYEEAINVCREVLQRKGDEIEAFRILAESYFKIGNYPLAELIAARGLKAKKDDERLTFLLGKMLLKKNNIPGAIEKFRQAIAFNPDWIQARQEVGAISLSYRDFQNAAEQFQEVVNREKDNIPALLGLGIAYKGLGRYDDAEKYYKQILTLNENLPEVQWNLAILYHRDKSDFPQALKFYKKFKSMIKKDNPKMADTEKYIKEVEQTIVALKKMEEHKKKMEAAKKAAEQALVGILVDIKAKRFAVAEKKLIPVFEQMPNDLELSNKLRMALAKALIGQKKFEEAQPQVIMILGMDPENKEAAKLLQELAGKVQAIQDDDDETNETGE